MSNLSSKSSGSATTYIKGALIGVAVTLIFMCLFAAIILFCNIDRGYSVPFATVSLALGSFTAAYIVSKESERRGYLIGTLVGLVSFAVVTIISLIINRNGLTMNTLFHFIIIVLASAIGGILGVNKGKSKKYI